MSEHNGLKCPYCREGYLATTSSGSLFCSNERCGSTIMGSVTTLVPQADLDRVNEENAQLRAMLGRVVDKLCETYCWQVCPMCQHKGKTGEMTTYKHADDCLIAAARRLTK